MRVSLSYPTIVLWFAVYAMPASGAAQDTLQNPRRAEAERTFATVCAECHSESQSGRTPSRFSMSGLSPRAIVDALENGPMKSQGESLTRDQRVAVAEYISGRPYARAELPAQAWCAQRGPATLNLKAIAWMGFGGGLAGTGFQSTARAGLTAADVPNLTLAWAFAFPDAVNVRTKPTVVGDVMLVGGSFGEVYALDAQKGCVRWSYEADAGVRGAILVGAGKSDRAIAYFVDFRTNAYALDVAAGTLLWKTRVGRHPEANTTGTAVLHAGQLIVPISSMEVVTAGNPAYECCTSSGAVASLNAATGAVTWYYRVTADSAREVGKNAAGTAMFAPSGAPVWASPTVDAKRGLVYVGTGENYTRPTTATSDAILALRLDNGALAWSFQASRDDAFTMACSGLRNRENCPSPPGPDHDFGMSPILATRADGKEILVVGQKSGVVFALDPDAKGAPLWSTRVGKGSALGGIHWGMATDSRYVYAANADRASAVVVKDTVSLAPSPGLYALDLVTGKSVWARVTACSLHRSSRLFCGEFGRAHGDSRCGLRGWSRRPYPRACNRRRSTAVGFRHAERLHHREWHCRARRGD
ncbi:MAG: PQQ-binding-like beta-propeller repeat protein [Gemmatimonadaceae bacterium]|nr:PQQ-binding-like beta-propeller repeat protein [Gemmatimonadaceae bacterium]